MKQSHSLSRAFQCVLAVALLLEPLLAQAYIDPNAGGVLFQLLAPLFLAIAGAWVFLRRVIGNFFRSLIRRLTGRKDQ